MMYRFERPSGAGFKPSPKDWKSFRREKKSQRVQIPILLSDNMSKASRVWLSDFRRDRTTIASWGAVLNGLSARSSPFSLFVKEIAFDRIVGCDFKNRETKWSPGLSANTLRNKCCLSYSFLCWSLTFLAHSASTLSVGGNPFSILWTAFSRTVSLSSFSYWSFNALL